jgi:hypothetical protein
MFYRLLAELVVLAHFCFIAFVAGGALLAWQWPRLLWLHLPAVVWAVAIVMVGFPCPLTPLENHLRRRAGQAGYAGGFVDHYLTGVIYPGRLTALIRTLVAAVVVTGYARLLVKRRRARVDAGR